MRIRRRAAAVVLMAAALGVGLYAIANATISQGTGTKCSAPRPRPATDNQSCLNFQFLPKTGVPATTFKNGSLEVRVNTTYAHPGDKLNGGYAHKVELSFDSDFKVTPLAKTCSQGQVAGKKPSDALKACGDSGTNNAWLSTPGSTVFNGSASTVPAAGGGGNFNGCVLTFNGPKNAAGNPTITLYARVYLGAVFHGCGDPHSSTENGNTGGTTVTLSGVLTNTTAPYGKKLTVDNIDNLPLALDDFDAKVQRGSYISAKCSGHNGTIGGSKYWKMKGQWTYSGSAQPADTATATETCSN
jgi:hypothetical protein